jgi:hypothetical protein
MRLLASIALAAVLGAVPLFAQAQNPQHVPLSQRFAAANVTRDGCLTLQQAMAARMRGVVRQFPMIDVKHRGCVTLDEIRLYRLQAKVQREDQ